MNTKNLVLLALLGTVSCGFSDDKWTTDAQLYCESLGFGNDEDETMKHAGEACVNNKWL